MDTLFMENQANRRSPLNTSQTDDSQGVIPAVQALDEATAKAARKAHAKNKRDFELHVSLIMRTEEVTKSHAIVTAYAEGDAGLVKRLDK